MSIKRNHIITVTGDLGSGKSHVCRLLAERLGARVISTGSIQREIASEMGITTLELNKLSEKSPEIDHRIDAHIQALADSDEKVICDSRLAWHFIPHSFKVCLTVDLEVAARRVLGDKQRSGEKYESLAEAVRSLRSRRDSEVKRFRDLYGIDCRDRANFDLVLDTSHITPEVVCEAILYARGADEAG